MKSHNGLRKAKQKMGANGVCTALRHGAWRLEGLGPGAPDFHSAAAAVSGAAQRKGGGAGAQAQGVSKGPEGGAPLDAVGALRALGSTPHAGGRLTGELPGRGRIQLGGAVQVDPESAHLTPRLHSSVETKT